MEEFSRGECLIDLARRLLDGEAIDWDKEGLAAYEVREGMRRLQKIVGLPGATESPAASPPPSRDRFIGEFRLVRKLGEGGMGVVYEAEQQQPKRPVAAHAFPDTFKLFRREIQTLARWGRTILPDGRVLELKKEDPIVQWKDPLIRRFGRRLRSTTRVPISTEFLDRVRRADATDLVFEREKPR